MLRNISLSSCIDQVKFAIAYKNFNIKEDYSKQIKTTFELTKDYFQRKISDYNEAKRKITENVTIDDYEYFKELFKNSKCYLCNEGFTKKINQH
jgi:ribosomal protein L14E/L6E/L27E